MIRVKKKHLAPSSSTTSSKKRQATFAESTVLTISLCDTTAYLPTTLKEMPTVGVIVVTGTDVKAPEIVVDTGSQYTGVNIFLFWLCKKV